MFDFIPIGSYTAVYYNVLMIIMLITLFHSYQYSEFQKDVTEYSRIMGFFVLLFVSIYIGTRPVSTIFADMAAYRDIYKKIEAGGKVKIKKDYLFNYFMFICTKIMSAKSFFLLCSLIYIFPSYWFSKKYIGSYWFFTFFIFVGSLMFWPFGTNGIRNGLATSIFILALCFYYKKWIMYFLMVIAVGMHNSLIIPVVAFLIASLYKNPKVYLLLWFASIPLSLIGGSFWESFFAGIGFGEDTRVEDYLTTNAKFKDAFAYTGFRWDFLFYSSFAVFAGWYYIFKKNVIDSFYIHLWGTYLIANAFWILIIRANFSNRFAYLSWFLMAPVIAYPLLRYKIWPNQYRIVGAVIAIYYLFTYFMFIRG